MEAMSYSIELDLQSKPEPIDVIEYVSLVRRAGERLLGVECNFDLQFYVRPEGQASDLSKVIRERALPCLGSIAPNGQLLFFTETRQTGCTGFLLFGAEPWIPEVRSHHFGIVDLHIDANSPLSALALIMVVSAAQYFNVSCINDSSGVWAAPGHQGIFDTICLPQDLDRLRVCEAQSFRAAVHELYARSQKLSGQQTGRASPQ
jgi:hypothetical protein